MFTKLYIFSLPLSLINAIIHVKCAYTSSFGNVGTRMATTGSQAELMMLLMSGTVHY